MDKVTLMKRTKKFAIEVIRFVDLLLHKKSVDVISWQIIKPCSSIASNYRAACRAKSKADFINKL
jgi:four helix bundle protein